jgi:integrase
MSKEGYSETTIERYVRLLKELAKHGDLRDPEMACGAYALYGFTFAPPRYRRVEKLPFIPLDSEVEQLIGSMGLRYSAFLSLLKDTAARPLEAWNLKWSDIDTERFTVTVLPEKNSNPRRLKVSARLVAMLNDSTM